MRKQLQIFNHCNVSFYSYLTSFSCTRTEKSKRKHQAVPEFTVDAQSGAVINAVSFDIETTRFVESRSSSIIHYCPYLKPDETDEASCMGLLIMYVPWPYGDETLTVDALLKWYRMKTDGCIPQYALHFIKRDFFRQGLSVGHPVNDDEHDDDNFNHQNSDRRGSG